MRRNALVIVVALVVAGYGGTWLWARECVADVIALHLKSQFAEFQRQHDSHKPAPRIDAEINWSVPVLPGLVVVSYMPMGDGRGAACFDYHAIVLSYGVGGKLLFEKPAPNELLSSLE